MRLLGVSPGGNQLGIVDRRPASTVAQLHDVPASFPKRQIPCNGPVRQLCYSPDGTMIASLSEPRMWSDIRVHHPRTCNLLLSNPGWIDAERYSQIGFSGDSRWLVALAGDGSLRFWDSRTGVPSGALRGSATRFTGFAFSPDNQSLATAAARRQRADLGQDAPGTLRATLACQRGPRSARIFQRRQAFGGRGCRSLLTVDRLLDVPGLRTAFPAISTRYVTWLFRLPAIDW